jgi:Tfp pilus assembly protein PilN
MGRADGQILLARTLPGNWNQDAQRLAVDLNRTILFVNQQQGAALNQGVWLFGPGAVEQREALQSQTQSPLNLSPVPFDPFYWATEALKLRPEATPNFIGVELQHAPQRRVFAKVVAASTALIVAASLGASAFFVVKGRQEQRNLEALDSQIARLEGKKAEFQRLDAELSRKKQVVQLVIGDRPPPAPAWLLAYLAEAVPSDLVVTNLQVNREEDFWKIKLAGIPQQGVKLPSSQPLSDSVAALKSRLAGPPFHLKISDPENQPEKAGGGKPPASGPSQPSWLDRLAGGLTRKSAPGNQPPPDHFEIQGDMR